MELIHVILLTIAILSTLIPIVVGIRERGNILFYYVTLSLTCDLIMTLFRRILHIEYHYVSNIFIIGEMIFLSLYYKDKVFKDSKWIYVVMAILAIVFFITLPQKSFLNFNKTFVGIFHFCVIIYSLLGLYVILKEQKELFLEQSSFFWANVAFMLYASTNVLFFLFSDYMKKTNHSMYSLLWVLLFLPMNTLKNILLAISFSKSQRITNKDLITVS